MPHKDPEVQRAYKKQYQIKHAVRLREQKQVKYRANRTATLARARVWRMRTRYGITIADYDHMFEAQNGVCYICETPPKRNRLAVDHCHKTGKVRGLLCARCNSCIARFQDNARALRRAATYLERPPPSFAEPNLAPLLDDANAE